MLPAAELQTLVQPTGGTPATEPSVLTHIKTTAGAGAAVAARCKPAVPGNDNVPSHRNAAGSHPSVSWCGGLPWKDVEVWIIAMHVV